MDALTDERVALLRLAGIPGVGHRRLRAAVQAVGSARGVLALDAPVRAEALNVPRAEPGDASAAFHVLERCRTGGVRVLGWHEDAYPPRLLHLADPPPVLYVLGDPACLHRPQVAVVGSRKATAYGRRTARSLGRGLADRGLVVLSGMALGVDGEAHRGALEGGGVSTAVLASGPERASPRQHHRLHAALVRYGAVASEHPPATPSLAHHFPVRNRLMAALALAVVVVEATRKSGALITVREAAALGRDVLAVPGPVDAPTSTGTNQLLEDGVAPALDAASVLRALGVEDEPSREDPLQLPLAATGALGPDAGEIWQALAPDPRPVDELARRAGLPVARALAALTHLEMEGWARQAPGLAFARRRPRSEKPREPLMLLTRRRP